MSRFASEKSGTFKQLEQGSHIARCFSLIDIGQQPGEYEGKPTLKSKVIIGWEVPSETIELDDGTEKPMVISRFITNSLSERSQMRPMLESWRGKAFSPEELMKFDLQNIVGKPCLITVVHVDGKARVSSVSAMPKGMTCPPQINPTRVFWLDEWDPAAFAELSEGIQKLVKASVEYRAFTAGDNAPKSDAFEPPHPKSNAADDFADDLPF